MHISTLQSLLGPLLLMGLLVINFIVSLACDKPVIKKNDEILLCVVFLNDHETECWKP